MYGIIPDARSATFDIWRDYEDIRVSDVAYLLRLNHSRLLVANLKWRPDLKQDIKVSDLAVTSVWGVSISQSSLLFRRTA